MAKVNWGATGRGAATGAGIGSMILPGVGTAIGAGIGGVTGMIRGSGPDNKPAADADNPLAALGPIIQQLQKSSATTRATGADLKDQGNQALQPVIDYFTKLSGGDPSAVAAATQPERKKVIDQYDTARRAVSEFGPRGGGTNAALAGSQFDEASELSSIAATARGNASNALAGLGTQLTGLGLSADQLASADLNTVMQAVMGSLQLNQQKDLAADANNAQMTAGMAEGLGTLIGLILTRGGDDGSGFDFGKLSELFSGGGTSKLGASPSWTGVVPYAPSVSPQRPTPTAPTIYPPSWP